MGSGKLLGALGALVVLAVGAGIWLVMDESPATAPSDDAGTAVVEGRKPDKAPPPKKDVRRHAKVAGTCEVAGVVKRRLGEAPQGVGATLRLRGRESCQQRLHVFLAVAGVHGIASDRSQVEGIVRVRYRTRPAHRATSRPATAAPPSPC